MLLCYFSLCSLLAFCITALDKRRAVKSGWRIKERTLLLLALSGGAAGELFAMLFFRHKIRKPKFYLCVPLFLLLHLGIYLYFGGFLP